MPTPIPSVPLIPQPQRLRYNGRRFRLPDGGTLSADTLFAQGTATYLAARLPGRWRTAPLHDPSAWFMFEQDSSRPLQGYRMDIRSERTIIYAATDTGAFYAVQTLLQMIDRSQNTLDEADIEDAPAFPVRGVYYDLARGRVPKRAALVELCQSLAGYKINQLQLYMEHTFAFKKHPLISKGAGAITPHDILALERICEPLHIELVPSLACFGHMNRILSLPPYRHLAEDRAAGVYEDTAEFAALADWKKKQAWSIAPANPHSYSLLQDLLDELLPLFRSRHVNVCCDEVFDIGMGQSNRLLRRLGPDGLFLKHVLQLRKLARRHGKTIQIWGDMIHQYPTILNRLPKDITVLDWDYRSQVPETFTALFADTRHPYYVCPGTSSWVALFPRFYEAMENIHRMATAGRRLGAQGLLNTDWGDGGHYNFMQYSWPAYAFGAEQAWNPEADRSTFFKRYCQQMLAAPKPEIAAALARLAEISHLNVYGNAGGKPLGHYQSIWLHLFFAPPDSPLFRLQAPRASFVRNGQLVQDAAIRWNAATGRRTAAETARIRRVFQQTARCRNTDPHGLLPYWIFAADTTTFAAKKLAVFGRGGANTPARRRKLAREMSALKDRFQTLWRQTNRVSEIRQTLTRYDNAIANLTDTR